MQSIDAVVKELAEDRRELFRMAVLLRLLLHAHAYTPVFSIVMLLPVQQSMQSVVELGAPAVALLYATGSIGSVITKRLWGHIAESRGKRFTILLGVALMSLGTLGVAITFGLYRMNQIDATACVVVAGMLQLLFGSALALIEGPDRDILQMAAGMVDHDLVHKIRRIDWAVRSAGVSLGAAIGAIVFVATLLLVGGAAFVLPIDPRHPVIDPAGPVGIAGIFVFGATGVMQAGVILLAAKVTSQIPDFAECSASGTEAREFVGRAVRSDTALRGTILLASVVDGWLVFLCAMLGVSALKLVLKAFNAEAVGAGHTAIIGVGLVLAFWALASTQLVGTLLEGKLAPRMTGLVERKEYAHLVIALAAVAVGIGALAIYLTVTAFYPGRIEINVCGFVLMSVLRGFSRPMLTNALDDHVKQNPDYRRCVNTIRGRASGQAFLFQFITAGVSVGATFVLYWKGLTAGQVVRDALTVSISMILFYLFLLGKEIEQSGVENARRWLRELFEKFVASLSDAWRLCNHDWKARLLFAGCALCLVASNVLGSHVYTLAPGFSFNRGAVFYAMTFLFVDVCVERFGPLIGFRLYAVGVLANLVGTVLCWVGSTYFGMESLKVSLAVFGGSMLSFTLAQFLDVRIFARLHELCGGHGLWARIVIAGFVSQAVDTVLFVSIASSPPGAPNPYAYLAGQFLVKLDVIVLVIVPMAYVLRRFCSR